MNLQEIARKVEETNGLLFMGSQWENLETEMIAAQTISACAINERDHGEALSWQGKTTLRRRGMNGVDNQRGVVRLVDGEYLILEPYTGDLTAPDNIATNEDGVPMVFRCTEKLLNYASSLAK